SIQTFHFQSVAVPAMAGARLFIMHVERKSERFQSLPGCQYASACSEWLIGVDTSILKRDTHGLQTVPFHCLNNADRNTG
ncbi:MAG: hypothetical protein Q8O57_01760, partial [Kiritimatiellota bacterium]|nr:hypothetical protein [Kiritimatiellota bacterium]